MSKLVPCNGCGMSVDGPCGLRNCSMRLRKGSKREFKLGNCLRGHFGGTFTSIEEAWDVLSRRFLMSYPVEPESSGRFVQMYVSEPNKYGITQQIICKEGNTSLSCRISDEAVSKRAKRLAGTF